MLGEKCKVCFLWLVSAFHAGTLLSDSDAVLSYIDTYLVGLVSTIVGLR